MSGECEECSEHTLECKCSLGCDPKRTYLKQDDGLLSLQDIVNLIEKKYGKEWIKEFIQKN